MQFLTFALLAVILQLGIAALQVAEYKTYSGPSCFPTSRTSSAQVVPDSCVNLANGNSVKPGCGSAEIYTGKGCKGSPLGSLPGNTCSSASSASVFVGCKSVEEAYLVDIDNSCMDDAPHNEYYSFESCETGSPTFSHKTTKFNKSGEIILQYEEFSRPNCFGRTFVQNFSNGQCQNVTLQSTLGMTLTLNSAGVASTGSMVLLSIMLTVLFALL